MCCVNKDLFGQGVNISTPLILYFEHMLCISLQNTFKRVYNPPVFRDFSIRGEFNSYIFFLLFSLYS